MVRLHYLDIIIVLLVILIIILVSQRRKKEYFTMDTQHSKQNTENNPIRKSETENNPIYKSEIENIPISEPQNINNQQCLAYDTIPMKYDELSPEDLQKIIAIDALNNINNPCLNPVIHETIITSGYKNQIQGTNEFNIGLINNSSTFNNIYPNNQPNSWQCCDAYDNDNFTRSIPKNI